MTLLEVDHAANIIRQSVNPDANIIFGSLIDESLQGKLKISIFATGIEATGKKILYYPDSEKDNSFSSLKNKINQKADSPESKNDSSNSLNDDTKMSSTVSEMEETQFNLQSESIDEEKPQNIASEASTPPSTVNYKGLEEKKKTGFFSMLSNLMSSDKKELPAEEKAIEKKEKPKKTKTDPNLFLFSDVVEESDKVHPNNDVLEISEISDNSLDSDLIDEMDTPSYLRKGSSQS